MSEALEKPSIHPLANVLRSISLSGLLLTVVATQASGEGLAEYGARMCADAGIPLEDCSLVSEPSAAGTRNAESGGGKAATLVEHGRRVCEQENVPLEDCQALPSGYRADQAPPVPVPVPPSMLPPVDPALLAASPPPHGARRVVRTPAPPAPLPIRPAGAAPALAGDPGTRYLRPPAPPAYRYAPAAAPVPALPIGPDTRYLQPPPPPAYRYAPAAAPVPVLPIEPDTRYLQPPPPRGEPAFRFAEEPAPFVERGDSVAFQRERPERFFRQDRFFEEESFRRGERFGRNERFRGEERSGRCRRAVRFPGPGSSRYITC